MSLIKLNKSTIIKSLVFSLIGLFLFWFIGWESNRYDENDKEIGSNIVFTVPMVLIKNPPDNYAGEFIAEKYDAFLTTADSWKNLEASFPKMLIKSVSCNEVFVIDNALHNEKHGLLARGFSPDVKFYVLSSNNIKNTVVWSGNYQSYSSTDLSIHYNCQNKLEAKNGI